MVTFCPSVFLSDSRTVVYGNTGYEANIKYCYHTPSNPLKPIDACVSLSPPCENLP